MAPKQKTTYRKYSEESLHKALDAIKGKFLIQKSLCIKHWTHAIKGKFLSDS